jgi:UDPglucose 6-dehydrogenase
MNVSVIGAGYVGLVSSACLADVGNSVLCMDLDRRKIAQLAGGEVHIHEPGLAHVVRRNCAAGRLAFTTSYPDAVAHADVIFIAVGTPPGEDGSADLSHALAAARAIGRQLARASVVVVKSTVPVGTAAAVRAAIAHELGGRGVAPAFQVVSNPEFLKEGAAVHDFMRPDRIVIGSDDSGAAALMRQLYQPFNRGRERLIEMDIRSAELTKYAANAMLATRISFMNELAELADVLGADIEAVRRGTGADPRIGPQFLYAGAGYGGSCFPKDVNALLNTARGHARPMRILSAVQAVNESQKNLLFQKMCLHFGGAARLRGATIALWGLAFKPDTDDVREAPSLVLIGQLLGAGCRVKAYDPAAREAARSVLRRAHGAAVWAEQLQLADDPWQAVDGADALVLITEWQQFQAPDFGKLAAALKRAVVFDGRNLFDPLAVCAAGLDYRGIGRSRDAGPP